MKSLKEYINTRLANGKYFFSRQDTLKELGLTPSQFRFQAYRLSQKKAISRLWGDFFMIIPAEYFHLGSLPSHWIIDPLMKYLNQDYYIGLLSAASLYGATEQQPMTFQVITNKTTKPIQLDRGNIEFHSFKNCSSSLVTTIQAPTGTAKISKKEQTLVDLLRFYDSCGHLSNVASVIKSLAPECDPETLAQVAKKERTTSLLQRLGYILELAKFPKLAQIIEHELLRRRTKYILLQPDFPTKEGIKLNRWKLILNDTLELS